MTTQHCFFENLSRWPHIRSLWLFSICLNGIRLAKPEPAGRRDTEWLHVGSWWKLRLVMLDVNKRNILHLGFHYPLNWTVLWKIIFPQTRWPSWYVDCRLNYALYWVRLSFWSEIKLTQFIEQIKRKIVFFFARTTLRWLSLFLFRSNVDLIHTSKCQWDILCPANYLNAHLTP